MARGQNPDAFAAKLKKWADAGFNYGAMQGARAALRVDEQESVSRAPKRTGALARTIRVVQPTLAATKRRGFFRLRLSAGSRSKSSRVTYASVHQYGMVGYPPTDRTAPHRINATKAGVWYRPSLSRNSYSRGTGKLLRIAPGVYRRSVNHPGSHFRALHYLAINEQRAKVEIKSAIGDGAQKAGVA